VASVERKSLVDLVASLTSGKLKFAVAELAALPRAAVVVEDRYSRVFKLDRVRPAVVADGLAELQVGWPNVPIVFCETRQLAEEWTYRFLAAAHSWSSGEAAAVARLQAANAAQATGDAAGDTTRDSGGEHCQDHKAADPLDSTTSAPSREPPLTSGPTAGRQEPAAAQVRAWARAAGLDVPDRGRLRPEIWQAWRAAST
jgi:hypothetical protein